MVYPAFGVVFAKGVSGFSLETNAERRHAGDRTALWSVSLSPHNYHLPKRNPYLQALHHRDCLVHGDILPEQIVRVGLDALDGSSEELELQVGVTTRR